MPDLATLANLATALAVVTGVVFGVLEVRAARRERQERAALSVVATLMTPEWLRSVVLVQALPDEVAPEVLEADRAQLDAAQAVGILLEGLGYSVFCGVVPLRTVDELLGGSVRVAWRKLRAYVEHERRRSGSQKSWEWVQWLAERLEEERRLEDLQPAYLAHRDWRG